MPPSSALQSKISVFETLSNSVIGTPTTPHAVRRKPPPISSNPMDSALSPNGMSVLSVLTLSRNGADSRVHSPSSSPTYGKRIESSASTSFVDLKDWVVEDHPVLQNRIASAMGATGFGPRATMEHGSPRRSNSVVRDPNAFIPRQTGPLISFDPSPDPPRSTASASAPPLPPRKPSLNNLRNVSKSTTPSLKASTSGSNMLGVDHTYPPPKSSDWRGHVASNSASSFHSVSLSDHDKEDPQLNLNNVLSHASGDRDSLAESFENVSPSTEFSPTSRETFYRPWQDSSHPSEPPKLPQRPSKAAAFAERPGVSLTQSAPPSTTIGRRVPPPPPGPPSAFISSTKVARPGSSRASLNSISSDKSSILSGRSTATSHTSSSLSHARASAARANILTRPTPVPPTPRMRFEALFNTNLAEARNRRKRARQAAGWRGLSVDLSLDDLPAEKKAAADHQDRLSGAVVKRIWDLSKLERGKLRVIWNQCDPERSGHLNRESFVLGMWKIDEELRRAQTQNGKARSLLHFEP